jgi:hypothetical protein
VDAPGVADASLVYVHANPQLVRGVFDFSQRRPLLIDAVFAIGDVARFGEVYQAALAPPDLRELLPAPLDEPLAVKGVEQRPPRGLLPEQTLVLIVAPVE